MAITASITGGNVQLSGNPVYVDCSGGSAPAGSSEYKITLRVISEDGKLEGSPFTVADAPDSSGNARFDISAYVDQDVAKVFQYPLSGAYQAYPTQAFNIQVQPGESYIDSNGDLVETWNTVSSIIQMLKGGLAQRQITMMTTAGETFYSKYITGDKWLTARPQGDKVHPTQNVKLWYMVGSTIAATYKVKVHYDDATDNTYSVGLTLDEDNLYEFNCNPVHLGLVLEPTGKRATYFEVWLDFGGPTSHVRNFYFDWEPVERPFFLFFANSLGGIDDVYFAGDTSDRFLTRGSKATRAPQPDDTVFTPTLLSVGKVGQNAWALNSGYKSLTTMQYYRDLMLAQQAWYLYSNLTITTYSVIPILIEAADKEIVDRAKNIFSFDLRISEAHEGPFVHDNRSY